MGRPLTDHQQLLLCDLRLTAAAHVIEHLASELGRDDARRLNYCLRHVEEAESTLGDVLESIEGRSTRPI